MKIKKLVATGVHGYLPLDIDFFEDLTFLTGLNGSGKTSALRLLMALLTPNIEELGAISYADATVSVAEADSIIEVSARRIPEGVALSISTQEGSLEITSAELEILQESKRREEHRSPVMEKYRSNPIYRALRDMSTPMFLGLDRRFSMPGVGQEETMETRRREYFARRFWPEDPSFRNTIGAAGLIDVNYLVVTRMQEIRAAQEQLDERLRAEIFTKAFEYKPSDLMGKATRMPSRAELNLYRKQLTKIEDGAESVKIPVPEIQAAVKIFLERMGRVVESLDKTNQAQKGKRKTKNSSYHVDAKGNVIDADYIEWIVNKPQADRIVEHLSLLEKYIEDRDALRDPIARFLSLVNEFFAQTKKTVSVAPTGQLEVVLNGTSDPRPISALSSGERQLLVMLAHLSLNTSLTHSGVFIVDEPELSLHIDWQEKFVDAIRAANPNVQLVLATHSPAIILDRDDACRSLS